MLTITKTQRAAPAAALALVSKSNAIQGYWERPDFADYDSMAIYRYANSTAAAADTSATFLGYFYDETFVDFDDDLTVGEAYYYRVATVDIYGHESVKDAAVAVIYQPVKLADTDQTALSAPATPTITQVDQDINGDGSVDTVLSISSATVASAVRYEVEVSEADISETADHLYNSVVALWNFDGSAGSTTFTNGAPVSRSLTSNNAAFCKLGGSGRGGVMPDFGTNVLEFSGGSGGYAYTDTSTDLQLDGDFTLEFYTYIGSTSLYYNTGFFRQAGAADGAAGTFALHLEASSMRLKLEAYGGSLVTITTTSAHEIITGMWTHICIERKGSTIYIFQDGVIIGTGTCSGTLFSTGAFELGRSKTTYSPIEATMDAFRLTKGVARYGGKPFYPPTQSLATSYTALSYAVVDNITTKSFPVLVRASVDKSYRVRVTPFSFNGTPGAQSGYSSEVRPGRRNVSIPLPTALTIVNGGATLGPTLKISGMPTKDKSYDYTEVWISMTSVFGSPILWATQKLTGVEDYANLISFLQPWDAASGSYWVKVRHVDKIGNKTLFFPLGGAAEISHQLIAGTRVANNAIDTEHVANGAITSLDNAQSGAGISIGTSYVDVHSVTVDMTDVRFVMFSVRFIAVAAGTFDIQIRQNTTEVFAISGIAAAANELVSFTDIYLAAVLPNASDSFTLRVKRASGTGNINNRRLSVMNIKK